MAGLGRASRCARTVSADIDGVGGVARRRLIDRPATAHCPVSARRPHHPSVRVRAERFRLRRRPEVEGRSGRIAQVSRGPGAAQANFTVPERCGGLAVVEHQPTRGTRKLRFVRGRCYRPSASADYPAHRPDEAVAGGDGAEGPEWNWLPLSRCTPTMPSGERRAIAARIVPTASWAVMRSSDPTADDPVRTVLDSGGGSCLRRAGCSVMSVSQI